jgi:predicted GH43/DUF377 family glycosyl hydrolase
MHWKKGGVVWKPQGDLWWAKSHATCPTPLLLNNGILRIYIQCRDEFNVGRVGFVDVEPNEPTRVIKFSQQPVFDIGSPGTFDDNGVLHTSVIYAENNEIYMYYAGFELCHRIRYRLLTGVAKSTDGGESFTRVSSTPILERSPTELFIRGGPYVHYVKGGSKEQTLYKMWYVAGSEWEQIQGKSMPVYHVCYAESADGITWPSTGRTVLPFNPAEEHGIGRPYVIQNKNSYQMFYSVRKKSPCAYRLGYAESPDGIHWNRKDNELGLDVSAEGWDSESIEYSAIVQINNRTFCFYNGNDFGSTGFGVAELIS